MDARVRLVRHDVVELAAVDTLGALDGLTQRMAATLIVADHAACHAQLLWAHDAVLVRDDTRTWGNVNARGLASELVENQRVEHVDALGDDDGVLVALHGLVAADAACFEVVDRQLHELAVHQAVDILDE